MAFISSVDWKLAGKELWSPRGSHFCPFCACSSYHAPSMQSAKSWAQSTFKNSKWIQSVATLLTHEARRWNYGSGVLTGVTLWRIHWIELLEPLRCWGLGRGRSVTLSMTDASLSAQWVHRMTCDRCIISGKIWASLEFGRCITLGATGVSLSTPRQFGASGASPVPNLAKRGTRTGNEMMNSLPLPSSLSMLISPFMVLVNLETLDAQLLTFEDPQF